MKVVASRGGVAVAGDVFGDITVNLGDLPQADDNLAPIVPQRRDRFISLLARHELIGGREEVISALDKSAGVKDGYVFVTGASGYGKTALLANWVRRQHDQDGIFCCYSFVSRIDGTQQEDF